MKKILSAITGAILLVLLISCATKHEYTQTFETSPASPKTGEEITVYYSNADTPLKDSKNIEMLAYIYNEKLIETLGLIMKSDGDGFMAKFKPTGDAFGVLITFRDTDSDKTDNNKIGYRINLTDMSEAGYAVALADWGYYAGIDNREQSREIFDKVFEKHPASMPDYADIYFNSVWRTDTENRETIIGEGINQLTKLENKPEETLQTIVQWSQRIGNQDLSDEYEVIINNLFPTNEVAQGEEFGKVRRETDLVKKLEMTRDFEKKFPESDFTKNLFYWTLEEFRKANKVDEAISVIKENPARPDPYIFKQIIEYCLANEDHYNALELSKIYTELSEKEHNSPSDEQPKFMTTADWKKSLKANLGRSLNYLAESQLASNLNEEALVSAEKSYQLTEAKDINANLTYANAMWANDKVEECLTKLKEFVSAGKSNSEMKSLLKDVYVEHNGSEEGFDVLLADLEKQALAETIEKLTAKIINEPAPQFTLTNMDGKEVSLADFKGKTVVVDFWATWCGPCRVSFPGMQKAVDKYSAAEDVEFLFVNTWERVEDKLNNAKTFVKNNNYTFNVLMDYDNKVVGDFKVSGIPTKFVIDGNGNIRFKSVGGDDNIDKLVDELTAMITLASQGA